MLAGTGNKYAQGRELQEDPPLSRAFLISMPSDGIGDNGEIRGCIVLLEAIVVET